MNEKNLWNKLATRDYRYYILARKNTDEEFDMSGESDCQRLVLDDEMITKRKSILEIGCGAGRLLIPMARDFETVIGIDISEIMIGYAKDRLKNCNNVTVMATDGKSIPCQSDSIDFIFSYIVFQHIKDYSVIKNYFNEIHRTLKRGGLLKILLGRTEYKNLNAWWSGVCCTDEMISELTNEYKVLKQEYTSDNRVWLWLEK